MDTSNIPTVAVTVVIAMVMVPILASFTFGGTFSLDPAQGSHDIDDEVAGEGAVTNVRASKGNALLFNNNDNIEIVSQNFSDGSWTVCAALRLSDAADPNATYTAYAWDNGSLLLQYDAGTWSIYYANESGADGKAEIDAPNPTSGYAAVCGRYNATSNELVVVRNGTVSAPDGLDATTDARNVSETWNGSIDEVRTFNDPVNNSSLQAYGSDPVTPLPAWNRTARYMFDAGSGDTVRAFFTSLSSVKIDGTTWTDGVSPPGLDKGSDYEISRNPLTLVIPQGSYLIGAPIVWITWSRGGLGVMLIDLIPAMVGLLILTHVAYKADLV